MVARIARLERTGVVAGYGVRLGAPPDSAAVRAWCSLSLLPQTAPAVLRPTAMPEVEESRPAERLRLPGFFCAAPATSDWTALPDQIGQMDGVHRTQTSIVPSRKIDRRSGGLDPQVILCF